MNWKTAVSLLSVAALTAPLTTRAQSAPGHWKFAPTPPMGWNSWDSFGTTITDAQARAQADAMAQYLKPSGYDIFTVDIQWYEPDAQGHDYKPGAPLEMDGYSRLMPAVKKFPSAAGGTGFKVLADYVHAKGLRFGIHIMRGIPRQAVRDNTPILGTTARAADVADTKSVCPWNPDMYGVDMRKPGAQEYYDSLLALYAAWGVDFIKCDDISRPYNDGQMAEIEALDKAIQKTGRPIVLSLSPGDTPIERGGHVMNHANMWRISDDFWDRWEPLHGMFDRLEKWTKYRTEGAWPDADMLPFGTIDFGRKTRFTENEQVLCMTLWCIARSPLIYGGDMTKLGGGEFTLQLLTNPEVIAVDQASSNNRQLSREDDLIVWSADVPNSSDRYVALFNAQGRAMPYDFSKALFRSDVIRGEQVAEMSVPLKGAKTVALVVDDGGDGWFYDRADWIEPVLTGPQGTLDLSTQKWKIATAGAGEVRANLTHTGQPIQFGGKVVKGIGTHANSLIEFDVPEGYDTFTAKGIVSPSPERDRGRGSVRFLVLTEAAKLDTPDRRKVSVALADLGIDGDANVRDLWQRKDLGVFHGKFEQQIPMHSAGLYRISLMR